MPTYVGTLGDDNIGAAAAADDVIYGLDGNDVITGSFYPAEPFVSGHDIFLGSQSMRIEGGDGNDTLSFDNTLYPAYYPQRGGYQEGAFSTFGDIDGGRGDDSIYGASGVDSLFGDDGNDIISGGGGNDGIEGGDGGDSLFGGDGDDFIFDGDDNDTAYGEAGNDFLVSGFGNDVLVGGDGNDTILGFASSGDPSLYFDYMEGDAGVDLIVFGSVGAGQAYGGADNDTIVGANQPDYMQGDAGNDMLFGYGGNDIMVGGSGVDTLTGGTGSDFLLGGAGIDGFYFNDGGVKAGEYDQVGDFEDGVDFVYLQSGTSYTVTDTSLGALLYVSEGGNNWGVFFSGATAYQVADQIVYA